MMVTFRVALKRGKIGLSIVEIEFQPFQQLVVFTQHFMTSSDSAPLLCRLTRMTYRRPRGLASPRGFRRLRPRNDSARCSVLGGKDYFQGPSRCRTIAGLSAAHSLLCGVTSVVTAYSIGEVPEQWSPGLPSAIVGGPFEPLRVVNWPALSDVRRAHAGFTAP